MSRGAFTDSTLRRRPSEIWNTENAPSSAEPRKVPSSSFDGTPSNLALAPNGRLLLAGTYFINSQGHAGARLAEFDSGLRPCRSSDLGEQNAAAVPGGGAAGWTVIANTRWDGSNNEAVLSRYDAGGPCVTGDAIFDDEFEVPPAHRG